MLWNSWIVPFVPCTVLTCDITVHEQCLCLCTVLTCDITVHALEKKKIFLMTQPPRLMTGWWRSHLGWWFTHNFLFWPGIKNEKKKFPYIVWQIYSRLISKYQQNKLNSIKKKEEDQIKAKRANTNCLPKKKKSEYGKSFQAILCSNYPTFLL